MQCTSLRTWKAKLNSVVVGVLLTAATFAGAEPIGFVTDQHNGEIVVVDLSNGAVLDRIRTLDANPFEIALSPDGSTLYVTTLADTINIIDTENPFLQQRVGIGSVPIEIAVLPDGSKLYTANFFGGSVSVVDTASRTSVATIPTTFLSYDVATAPDGSRVYATSLRSSDLFVIDTALDTVVDRIPIGSDFLGHVAVTPDGRKAYITEFRGRVTVVDLSSRAVVRQIPFNASGANGNNGALDIAIDPQGTFAYVLGFDAVNVIDLATDTLRTTIPVGVQLSDVVVDSSGAFVYVTTLHQTLETLPLNAIVKINTSSLAIEDRFTIGGLPVGLVARASTPSVLQVAIDIKPGSYPNSINLGSSGVVPVAILSDTTFDATQVDPSTVRLANAAVKLKGQGSFMASFEDVNGDGRLDLVVQVSTSALQLTKGDTEALLEGRTFDGRMIKGTDTVRVVP